MTWLGKILAVMALLLALCWMWLTASVFAARTNWKTQADAYKKAFEEAKVAREAESRTNQSERDALARQAKTEQTRADGLVAQLEKAKEENATNSTALAKLTESNNTLAIKAGELQANSAAQQARADKAQAQVNSLEQEKIDLVIRAEKEKKERQTQETVARQAEAEKQTALKKVEELTGQLADARASGGGFGGGSGSLFAPRPVPVREGTRGTVESYKDGYVQITLGIDHGVTKGATLDVYRTGADAKYLGTVVIDNATPQQSVGTFRPADPRRNVRTLRPEELPKAGDRVGRIGSVSAAP